MTRDLLPSGVFRRLFRSLHGFEQRLGIATLAAALLLFAIDPAAARDVKIGTIEIGNPWSRATPPGAQVGGGYLTLANIGDTADTLVAVTLDGAERAEIHQMSMTDGVMKMSKVEGGLTIPPHGTVKLDPSGYHLMFIGLAKPLIKGSAVHGTLTFKTAGTVAVDFTIEGIGAMSKEMPKDKTKDMPGKSMPGMTMDH